MSKFHSYLIQYINTGSFSTADHFLSLSNNSFLFRKNANKLLELHHGTKAIGTSDKEETIDIPLSVYSGDNKFVLEMMTRLKNELQGELFGAYLHGSLATQEEIKYSDFDALIILKDAVFLDAKRLSRVAMKLNFLLQIMHKFDPLQHHGWFVLTESMLHNYPASYFPPTLFEHSKSLFENQGLSIELKLNSKPPEFDAPFLNLANSLIDKLTDYQTTNNSFTLKSVFSEFMLLPSLYVQAKNREGIYKKNSFQTASKDFSDEEWKIMNEVSAIRMHWDYSINVLQRFFLSRKSYFLRKLARKFAPAVSPAISNQLNSGFYSNMLNLVLLMKQKLNNERES